MFGAPTALDFVVLFCLASAIAAVEETLMDTRTATAELGWTANPPSGLSPGFQCHGAYVDRDDEEFLVYSGKNNEWDILDCMLTVDPLIIYWRADLLNFLPLNYL